MARRGNQGTGDTLRDEDRTDKELVYERELLRSSSGIERERLLCALESGAHALWELNVEKSEIEYSAGCEEMFGYAKGELGRGMERWAVSLCPHGESLFEEGRSPFFAEDSDPPVTYRMKCRDGTYKWVTVRREVLSHGPDGSPIWIRGTFTDATDQRFGELLLATHEDASLDGILVVDEAERILSFNRRFAYIWGSLERLRKGILYQDLFEELFGKCADPEAFGVTVSLLGRNPHAASHDEVRLGDGRIVDTYSVPVFGSDIRSCGRVWYFRDITGRKQAEAALRENEQKYRSLFENAKDAIFLLKGELIVDCNEKTLELFGCRREEMLGRSPYDFSPTLQPCGGESRLTARRKIEDAFGGTPQSFVWKHTRPDGTVFDADVGLVRIDAGGRSYVQAILRDVSERTAREVALRESENKFRDLTEKSVAGVYVIKEGCFAYVNAKLAGILGYTIDEMTDGLRPRDVVHPEDRAVVDENLAGSVSGEVRSLYYEFRAITKTGEVIHVETYGARTIYHGEPAVIGTLLDITERKRSERLRREAEEALHRREAELSALVEAMSDTILVVDRAGTCVRAILAEAGRLSFPPGSLPGRPVRDLLPPRGADALLRGVRKALKSGKTAIVEYGVTVDEGERWFSTAISPITADSVVCVERNITDLKTAEMTLQAKSVSLEEANTALRVLLRNVEEGRKELEETIASNIKMSIMPYIEKLRRMRPGESPAACLDVVEAGLRALLSPYVHDMDRSRLTPTEMLVADYVKEGKTTKEIMSLLHASKGAVDIHRYNIRRKLGLNKKKIGLRSYLLSRP